MKYVAFLYPDINFDGYDWLYNLLEDRNNNYYEFYLITAKNPEVARDKAVEIYLDRAYEERDIAAVEEIAFDSLCRKEWESDEEIFKYFGEKDGLTVLEFYKKYTWEALTDGEIIFFDNFEKQDRDKFFEFEKENLEKLFKEKMRYDILLMPITKEVKA